MALRRPYKNKGIRSKLVRRGEASDRSKPEFAFLAGRTKTCIKVLPCGR
jgi:hypothetical protein